ncbi:oligosaccharyl transferase delta subunit [Sistotremastrum niveocremeum HHB9708]|uniref:Ribophorin II n=1 Tax=Sistotremastrum niveocremeum HHB9708 TaxID=1314777 RepID=A0A164XV62_9AGAM|nr:oligosaccharyl transferase delta subunit [Sistotremastrum niveocremeum HHB9708]
MNLFGLIPSLLFVLFASSVRAADKASLEIQSAKLSVTSSDGSLLDSQTLSPPEAASPVTLGPTDIFKLAFTVVTSDSKTPVQPHQVFLRFYDPKTDEEGIHPIRVTSAGKAKLELNMAKPPLTLPPTTESPLEVTLLLGSYNYEPASFPLFSLTLPVSQPPPAHPDEASYHPLPSIFHTFRPEEKQPPQVISAVFTLLVLSPWFVLLVLWTQLPLSVPHLFSSEVLPFVVLLGAFEYLLVQYWVSLKLPQVLSYGAILGFLTAATGKRALSSLSKWRLGEKQ